MRLTIYGIGGCALALALATPVVAQTVAPAAAPVAPLVGGGNFISPMGEPVRSKDALSGAEHWFERVDLNGDGQLTRGEFRADADRFFAVLDTNHDGEIDPQEIEHYESDIAPEIRVTSTYGDVSLAKTDDDGNITDPPYPTRLGAGRFGYLDMPEPVVSADANMDRAISRQEFLLAADRRFTMLDANADGIITRADLPRLGSTRGDGGSSSGGGRKHGGRHRGGGAGGGGGGGN